jgi:zinc protease
MLDVNEIYDREKSSQYAHTVSFWWASSGLDYYATYVDKLRKVTREDITQYVRKYIKNKPRIVSALLSADDQKSISLTENDLLARGDSVAEDKTAKSPQSKARKPAAGKTTSPQPAGSGKLGNKKP